MSHLFKRRGKWLFVIAAVLLIAVLAGCTPTNTALHTTDDLKNSGSFWQSNVVYWFSLALDSFAQWFGGEYGLAVLLLVLIVRTLILPLTIKSVKSSKAMQAIQPEMQKLKEQFKDDPQRMQQEQMRLFQENKVNPAAGCLPLIVQMPIFIALYNAIIYNSELATHSFLWIKQLGQPDIPLTIFAAVTTFLQTWLMMRQNPAQQQGPMQFMLFVYPVLIFFMGYQFPSALPLYWAMSNVYTIVQNFFLYRKSPAKAAAAIAAQSGSTPAKSASKNGTTGGGVSLSKGAGPVASRKKKKKKR